ncbi:MAG: LPP20 family lipoprotein [Psychromonas sp.]
MKIKVSFVHLATLLLITACSSSPSEEKKPIWVDSAQTVYAENDYLTAVGQASTRERAGDIAITNLVEIFSVNIRSETNTLTDATRQDSALGVTSESSTSLHRNIQTETQQAISGVVIKDSWLSPNGVYYALAVLQKRSAALNLSESIIELDSNSRALINYSLNEAPNIILSINALRSARDLQLARKMANLQLKQVSPSGIPNDISSAKIERLIARKLASMQVYVDVNSLTHKQTVQSGLARLGASVVDDSSLTVGAFVDVVDPTHINNWYWLRGSYELTISENGQVISRKRWPIKVSAKQEELLNTRLHDNINAQIADYIVELISDSPTL